MEAVAIKIKPKKATYFPSIDGLRAIAVLFVLEEHFFPPAISKPLNLGRIGVDIFFVISGFLITGILLSYRKRTVADSLKTFYARRALRIFPIYYLYLIIVFIAGLITTTAFKWSLVYCTNFYFIQIDEFPKFIGHFWSLAVEEQFYMVWPFVILLTPRKFIKPVIIAVLIASLVFTAVSDKMTAYVHPLACANALALGGLLTVVNTDKFIGWRYTLVAVVMVAVCVYFYDQIPNALRTANALLGASLIINLTKNEGVIKRMFQSKVMVFLGSISYGIYVYHFLFRWDFDLWLSAKVRSLGVDHASLIVIPALFVLTVLTAYISYQFIEKPILRLKSRFK